MSSLRNASHGKQLLSWLDHGITIRSVWFRWRSILYKYSKPIQMATKLSKCPNLPPMLTRSSSEAKTKRKNYSSSSRITSSIRNGRLEVCGYDIFTNTSLDHSIPLTNFIASKLLFLSRLNVLGFQIFDTDNGSHTGLANTSSNGELRYNIPSLDLTR